MKYATIDNVGAVTGFYDDPSLAPANAVTITDAVWQDWVSNQQARRFVGGAVTTIVPPTPPAPPPVPVDARLWLERLSMTKQLAIAAAGIANPALLLWLLKAAGAQSGIVLSDPDTTSGVAALVAAGVLTTDDQATLLAP